MIIDATYSVTILVIQYDLLQWIQLPSFMPRHHDLLHRVLGSQHNYQHQLLRTKSQMFVVWNCCVSRQRLWQMSWAAYKEMNRLERFRHSHARAHVLKLQKGGNLQQMSTTFWSNAKIGLAVWNNYWKNVKVENGVLFDQEERQQDSIRQTQSLCHSGTFWWVIKKWWSWLHVLKGKKYRNL